MQLRPYQQETIDKLLPFQILYMWVCVLLIVSDKTMN
jgi:hypothetical protein